MGCALIGCGKGLPALDVGNDQLARLVDTSDEWIVPRTGIRSRRIATTETALDLSLAAARQALGWDDGPYSERRVDAAEIDLVVCATTTPDALIPTNAALLRRRLGLVNAVAFDMNAACSGFVYALAVVESMMAASAPEQAEASAAGAGGSPVRRNPVRCALVVGAERLSRIVNWADRSTCVLFGDGAGAAVLEWDPARAGILSSYLANEDDDANSLTCPMPYAVRPPFDADGANPQAAAVDPAAAAIDEELGIAQPLAAGEERAVIRMDGRRVFKFAGDVLAGAVEAALARAGASIDDVAVIVPHQANERIIRFAAKKMGRPLDQFQISIAHRGNSSAACVPMTLCDAYESGRIRRGDTVVLAAFGGGLTSGAIVYEV